jgi:outer membrane biosynthesis protein TonB
MFQAVLNPAAMPRRKLGTGAAFAVAAHLWLLVAGVALSSRAAAPPEPTNVPVSFVVSPPRAPQGSPPPLGDGRPPGSNPRSASGPRPRPKPLVPPDPGSPPPAATAEPAPPGASDAPPGSAESGMGVAGGDSIGCGPFGEGVPGGTGAGAGIAAPPASNLIITIGDPSLDHSTCELRGQPPYPREALAQKIEGIGIARCTVEPDGSLSGCKVLKASGPFEETVTSFLATARARPFTAAGKPARVACNFTLRFKLAQ